MKFQYIFLLLFYLFSIVSGDAPINILPEGVDGLEKVYIIQYEQTLSPKILLDRIRDAGINCTHRQNFEIIDSISVRFNGNDDVKSCSKISGVQRIWPVGKIKPRLFTAHKITGLNVLRQQTGLDGTGIKVGILDNGLDYMHPAFGQCFKTPGCKTQYGSDLIGNGDSNNPNPDDDPIETCEGHGTHVAGIIAADDHERNFSGVAPGVTLGIYRIIDCKSASTDELVLQGLQLASDDGMDIMNLSFGANFRGWDGTPVGTAVTNLVSKGFVIVASGSNAGDTGLFSTGDPDSSSSVISVGDVDNLQFLSFVLIPSNDPKKEIIYTTSRITLRFGIPGPIPLAIANTTTNLPESDGCSGYNEDFTGKMILIRRGQCDFTVKIQNAKAAGATAILFYNNQNVLLPTLSLTIALNFPSAFISESDANYLKRQIRKNNDLTITFPDKIVKIPIKNAGKPSNETAWGPTYELDIKPEVLAPGGRIFSTYPRNLGKYATLSGTSMATAYVSGSIALYMQARGLRRGNFDPIQLKELLTYSATPLYNKTHLLYSVNKQGGGLINIGEALNTKTIIKPSKLLLSDSEHFERIQKITIKNTGRRTTKYTLRHIPAPSVRGFFNNQLVKTESFAIEKHFAGIKFSKRRIKVRPGSTAKITIKFTQPRNMPNDFGVYSGYIEIKDSVQRTTSTLPYLGVKGNLCEFPLVPFPPRMIRAFPEEVIGKNDIGRFTFVDGDFPDIRFVLNFGIKKIVVELYKRGDFTQNGFIGLPILDEGFPNPSFLEARDLGTNSDRPWITRSVTDINGQNQFTVPNGQYQALLKLLKPLGDPENDDDFYTWKSPIIEIVDPTTTSSVTNTSSIITNNKLTKKPKTGIYLK